MVKKILVVVDDRVVTQSVIRQAIAMASALRADIHFFYVVPVLGVMNADLLPVAEFSSDGIRSDSMAHAKKMLNAASELAERAGIQSYQAIGSDPDAAQCVSEAAERKHCDLIFVGNEGKNAVLRLLNGSIVPRLISVASVPVLVCRENGSSRGFGRRASVSIRARERRRELLERRRSEHND